MGRAKNDGYGRLGGRAKGTPNKITAELKEWIAEILDNGREQFTEDLKSLNPADRIKVYLGLMNYVLPKQQSVSNENTGMVEGGITFVVKDEEEKRLIERIIDR